MKGRGERWGACGVRGREEKEGKREQRHQGGSPLLYWCGGVGAGTGGGGRYGGGATHRGFGEWPGVVVGRRRGPTTILSERQSQVVGGPRGSTG
jgi:hypothetical protein